MLNVILKNKILTSLVALFLIILLSIIIMFIYSSDGQLGGISGAQKATSLDAFVDSLPETFMSSKERAAVGFQKEELQSPVALQIPEAKITMVPKLMGGGDLVYEPVVELGGNNFAVITEDNINKIFKVTSPKEAFLYIDFLRTKMGKNSYDRSRETIFTKEDYAKLGCKDASGAELAMPTDQPITTATLVNGNYEVNWIYSSKAFPAGFFKEVFEVRSDGGVTLKEKQEKPFWPCGTGFLF